MSGFVSLTFDDALDVHLDNVVPRLDDHGLVGTFYTDWASGCLHRRLEEWRNAAASGHELGNHTILHPTSELFESHTPGNVLEEYSLERMRVELKLADTALTALDGQTSRTFAYTCGITDIGRNGPMVRWLEQQHPKIRQIGRNLSGSSLDFGSTRADYTPLARERFLAARVTGLHAKSAIPDISTVDRFRIPSASVKYGWTTLKLLDYVERGLSDDCWVVMTFHGVGGGHELDCDLSVFEALLGYLARECPTKVKTIRDGATEIWNA